MKIAVVRHSLGFVLVISMIILLLISLIVGAMLGTRDIEQKNTAMMKNKNIAMAQAENTTKNVLYWLAGQSGGSIIQEVNDPATASSNVQRKQMFVWGQDKANGGNLLAEKDDAWWNTYGLSAAVLQNSGGNDDTRIIIEDYALFNGKPHVGASTAEQGMYYRITVRASKLNSRATLETVVSQEFVGHSL